MTEQQIVAKIAGRRSVTSAQLRKLLGHSGKRGPNGRRLCTWCGTEVPPRRQSWCSDTCVGKFSMLCSPAYLRARVAERDGGVCAACGVDAVALREQYVEEARAEWRERYPDRAGFTPWGFGASHNPKTRARVLALGIPPGRLSAEWWDADHIVPLSEGGTNALDNLRTLCIPCHRGETTKLARRRAQRRVGRMTLLDEASA